MLAPWLMRMDATLSWTRFSSYCETRMTKPNLTREYLLSDEFKREFEKVIERSQALLERKRERRELRRRRLQRLTFGLLGR